MDELKRILRDLDKGLIGEGCREEDIDYSVHLNSRQASGIFANNESTMNAIGAIIRKRKYVPIVVGLEKAARDLDGDAYETLDLTRAQVYALRVEPEF